jgi:nucleotide-binding universal stress UspA family protein
MNKIFPQSPSREEHKSQKCSIPKNKNLNYYFLKKPMLRFTSSRFFLASTPLLLAESNRRRKHLARVHYGDETNPLSRPTVIDKATLKAYYDEEAEKVLKPIRTFFGKKRDLKVDFSVKSGPAADNIVAAATKGDFDMVIMGSHGHSTLGNLVMGSVATKVLAHCKTPVLLVR